MRICRSKSLLIWALQTGEPLPIDGENARPMRAINLCNALIEAGHKVVLFSSAFHHQEKRHRSSTFQRIQVNKNLELQLIPSPGYRRHISLARLFDHARLALNLKKVLLKEKNFPDVAFIGYPPIETAFVLIRWLASHNVPTLLDVKDQWPSMFLDAVPGILKPMSSIVLWPYYHIARCSMREASGLSAMSDSFLDWALEYAKRGRRENDGVFPLTSPLSLVSDDDLNAARSWWDQQGIEKNGIPRVCFVGSHMSVFDFGPVKEAAQASLHYDMPFQFIICGDGGYSTKLKKMMTGLPNVHFPGWIDRPKIVALAERCIGAIAPIQNIECYQRSLPNKIIDSLSLGLPILCPLQGEVATLISNYGVGLRYGNDSGKSLYECISFLVDEPDLQRNMSYRARALYLEKFSFEKVYVTLSDHLEKMAINRSNNTERSDCMDKEKSLSK